MMEIENWIPWASKGVVLKTTNGEVASSVDERLGYIGRQFPTISAFLKAVDGGTSEQEFDVRYVRLIAPEEIDVASKAARIVVQRRIDLFDIGTKV
jgi:hypothetical protein